MFYHSKGDEEERGEEKEREKEEGAEGEGEGADDPKAGADVRKIMNLMAGDTNKVNHYFVFG